MGSRSDTLLKIARELPAVPRGPTGMSLLVAWALASAVTGRLPAGTGAVEGLRLVHAAEHLSFDQRSAYVERHARERRAGR